MRRFTAHFALATIFAMLFAPFALATQEASLHACCLRAGAHHCQTDSHEAGVHSARIACPYASPLLLSTYAGLQTPAFRVCSLRISGFVTHPNYDSHSAVLIREAAARAPPIALL
jgi:hypothetical protein